MSMKFGMFDHVDLGVESIHDLYEGRMKLAAAADQAGFYCYHVAEHHGTEHGLAHSPNLFLAALSQRTKRIKLGSMVLLLPTYEPLRLIEEINMLDQMTGGRLQIGVGRGISPFEVGYFGVVPGEDRSRYHEVLEVLLQGLKSDVLDYQSNRFEYYDVPLVQRSFQKPHPPLWMGAHHNHSLDFAAQHGSNVLIGGPNHVAKAAATYYAEAWEKFADAPARQDCPVSDPLIGAWRFIYVAENDDEALKVAAESLDLHMDKLLTPAKKRGFIPNVYIENYEQALKLGIHIAGSPETVKAKIAADIEATGVNYMIFSVGWGSLTYEQSARSLDLFTKEVMPHFVGG